MGKQYIFSLVCGLLLFVGCGPANEATDLTDPTELYFTGEGGSLDDEQTEFSDEIEDLEDETTFTAAGSSCKETYLKFGKTIAYDLGNLSNDKAKSEGQKKIESKCKELAKGYRYKYKYSVQLDSVFGDGAKVRGWCWYKRKVCD